MAILQGARITGSIIATQFIKASGFSGSLTASRLYVQGSVGIGTTSPSSTKLHIVGDWVSGHSTVKVQGITDNTTGYGFYDTAGSRLGYLAYTGAAFEWYNNANVPMIFYTNTSEKMRIASGGNVGIGTTSPYSKLTVSVPATNTISTADSSNTAGLTISGTGNLVRLQFGVGSNTLGPYGGWIQASYDNTGGNNGIEPLLLNPSGGNVGIGTSSPSQLVEAYKSSNSDIVFKITNPSTGSVATAQYYASNGTTQSQFFHTGTNFAGAGVLNYAGLGGIYNSATGISLAATNASGVILFGTGTSATERMRIASNGNVGIGTTSPSDKLHIYGGSFKVTGPSDLNTGILLSSTSTNVPVVSFRVSDNSQRAKIEVNNVNDAAGDRLGFFVYQTGTLNERLSILGNGNIGMGTTAPGYKLDVISGSIRAASGAYTGELYFGTVDNANLYLKRDNNYDLSLVQNASSGNALYLAGAGNVYLSIDSNNNETDRAFIVQNNSVKSGTELFRVQENGYVGIGTSSPASKLTIQEIGTDGTPAIRLITTSAPSTFSWFMSAMNSSLTAGKNYIGLIGQAESQNNSGYIGFNYQGAGSTSNFLTFGFYQNDNLLNLRASGNVGIGTTSPASKLEVKGVDDATITAIFQSTAGGNAAYNGGIQLGNAASSQNSQIYHDSSGDNTLTFKSNYASGTDNKFVFAPGGTERVRFQQNGNVGIGTTAPVSKLHTYTSGTAQVFNQIQLVNLGASPNVGDIVGIGFAAGETTQYGVKGSIGFVRTENYGRGAITFYTNNTAGTESVSTSNERMRVAADGNVGIGTSSPNTKLHVYSSVAGSGTERTTPVDVLTLESENTTAQEFDGFGQTIIFRGSTYNNSTQRTLGKILHQINDDSVNTTRGTSLNFQLLTNATGTTLASRMFINYDGNIGIGTTSPAYKLDVSGSVRVYGLTGGVIIRDGTASKGNIRPSVSNGSILISDDSSSQTRGMTVNNNGGITVSTANASQNIIEGQANGSQVMCLNYNGNIGLGTSSPAAKLHVVGDAILNGLKSIQLDRTVAAAVNSYTNIGSFDIINGAHSFIVSINASLSGYSVAKTYVIANQYNATSGNWKIALPITDSGPYNDDFQLLVNFDTRYCSLRIRKSSGSTYSGAYSVTILYTGYTSATFTSDTNTGTDSSVLGILDSNVLTQVDGSVGIGTTSPTNKLHVSGSSTSLPLKLEGLTSNATGYFLTVDNTTGVVYKSTGGANGTSGTSGANGSPGSPGSSGTNGTSGTSGANGSPGTSGTSGANGSPGSSGATGTSGSSGSSVGGSPVRAYVYFNGTGTVTINGSNNVTSITDNGVGDYTVNFTTAFVDAYYTVAGTCTLDFTNASSLYNVGLFVPRQANAQVAGSCRLACEYYNNTLYDCVAVRAEFVRA